MFGRSKKSPISGRIDTLICRNPGGGMSPGTAITTAPLNCAALSKFDVVVATAPSVE